jgi:hypothetical protein
MNRPWMSTDFKGGEKGVLAAIKLSINVDFPLIPLE